MAISSGGQGKGSIFTEINITPLTDIFLVLLIVMMVIAPMFQNSNKEIKVPTINSGQGIDDNTVMVEITKAGATFINGTATTDVTGGLQKLLSSSDDKMVIVRADSATKNSEVMKVYSAASEAGFQKLTIAGEPLSASRQDELQKSPATSTDAASTSPAPVYQEESNSQPSRVEAPQ